MTKDIVILTSSYKHDGKCIAGIDTTTGEWIRPISDNPEIEGAVPLDDLRYEDGSTVQIYDIVRITMKGPKPTLVQPENWLYDDGCYWEKVGESSLNEVIRQRGYDDTQFVFEDTEKSLDRDAAFECNKSLLLLKVNSPGIFIKTFERKKVSFCFTYKSEEYKYFPVTEPETLAKYQEEADGFYQLGISQAVVFSLTEQYTNGKYYKVVAQFLH